MLRKDLSLVGTEISDLKIDAIETASILPDSGFVWDIGLLRLIKVIPSTFDDRYFWKLRLVATVYLDPPTQLGQALLSCKVLVTLSVSRALITGESKAWLRPALVICLNSLQTKIIHAALPATDLEADAFTADDDYVQSMAAFITSHYNAIFPRA